MDQAAILGAAQLLATAWSTGTPIEGLPAHARPSTPTDAVIIQREIARLCGERSTAWKAALSKEYGVLYALMLQSRTYQSGDVISAARMNRIGIEAEVAFRFDEALAPRDSDYSDAEVASIVTALPAIETLDTRFADFEAATALDKAADFMSNGAFISGAPYPGWRVLDLETIAVRVIIDGEEKIRKIGGHPAGSPLKPAVALANVLRLTDGIPAGTIVTTGSYTGTLFVEKSARVEIEFETLGRVSCRFYP